jgi:hypothetical protein
MNYHGVERVRIRVSVPGLPHPNARRRKTGSGGGTCLAVCYRPQVQARTVNSALQCAYRAAGRPSSFFVTSLFDSDHTKSFFLFPR